jgi:hypothetical protein
MGLQLFSSKLEIALPTVFLKEAKLVVVRLKVKDRTAVVHDLKKVGLQVSYAA